MTPTEEIFCKWVDNPTSEDRLLTIVRVSGESEEKITVTYLQSLEIKQAVEEEQTRCKR